MKLLLTVIAVVEAATGVALLTAPILVTQMLLGAEITGAAIPLGRVAGAGLLSLGLACWAARSDPASKNLLPAVSFYNIAAALILAAAGLQFPTAGLLLWLAVVVHAAISAWGLTLALRRAR